MSKPAVFLDRDGVINVDRGYVHKRDDFEYIDGVFNAVKKCKDMGYLLVLVTNQSGIARGMFTEEQFETLTEWMDWNFAENDIDFDATVERYKEECDCRKPNPGMFMSAQTFLDIDMENSVMIGDKKEDMMAAQAAGVGTRILVRTGKPVTEEGEALATTVLDSIADVPKFLFA
ncbi:UNVERIFIED_CONTAM: hypothetical protein GTU68_040108 [Idotea baltica]|nr:hypothetical protein [Idotea baltica]